MVKEKATHSSGVGQRVYSPSAPGYASFIVGVCAVASSASFLFGAPPFIRFAAAAFAVAGGAISIWYLVRFRRELTRHGYERTRIEDAAQRREVRLTSGAVVASCVGLAFCILALIWAWVG